MILMRRGPTDMLRRRLILIEGMIGAGKSTTAERLAARLTAAGEDICIFGEFADDHPIRTKGADRARMVDLPSADAYAASQWDGLATRCASGSPTVILESAFLQNSVMPYFIDDCSLAVVQEVFADIAARIAPTCLCWCICAQPMLRRRSGGCTPNAETPGHRGTMHTCPRVRGRAVVGSLARKR